MTAGCPLSVVVVSWNGAHLLPTCLDALRRQSLDPGRYELWVVDNASTDGTRALLAERYPQVRVVANERNEGFAGGCNSALRLITTPYAVLVNNDAIAEPDFLATLLAAAEREPDAAALTAKVLLRPRFVQVRQAEPDEPAIRLADGTLARPLASGEDRADAFDVVNSTGNEIRRDGNGQDRGWLTPDAPPPAAPDVFGFCGAAALLRMDEVRAAGLFDDRFFLYYEDTDLSWRLRLRGGRIRYVAGAVVRHDHAATSGEGSALHRFYNDRNRMLTLIKCAPPGFASRAAVRSVGGILLGLRHPRRARSGTRVRAYLAVLVALPGALRQRRAIGRTARTSRAEIARLAVADDEPVRYRG